MTKRDQLAEMMKLQDHFNQVVNPNWKNAGYPFHQALYVEASEATEHFGYKWWKKTDSDVEQTKMEMVDVFHFGLSMLHNRESKVCELKGFHQHMRRVIHSATAEIPYFNYTEFTKACESIGMSADDLYKLYLMKNVLNKFRQNNGYKEGTYIKHWGIEFPEDNVYLEHLFTIKQDWTFDELYRWLVIKYDDVLAAN